MEIDAGSKPQHPKHLLHGSSLLSQQPIVLSFSLLKPTGQEVCSEDDHLQLPVGG